ncbi:ATP-binding protein [Psychromonas ossibalaenae]|uniref:ATP-binding protein n=1 Tax=Psychromonas ossibalaenae TaxID=444922 RepID=UPI00037F60A9|nr:ATP-binding protein [Psychromonas ossibalaenae]
MSNWFKSKSLLLQISLIMLLGFSIGTLLTALLVTNERQQNISSISSSVTVNRVLALVEILSGVPETLHGNIIEASQGADLQLSIAHQPMVSKHQLLKLSKAQRAQFARVQAVDVRLRAVNNKRHNGHSNKGHARGRHGGKGMQGMHRQSMGYLPVVSGSVQLGSGKWLNFTSSIDEKSLQWSWYLLLSLLFIALLTTLLMLWTIKNSLKPVKDLADAADRMGTHRDFTPLKLDVPSDIKPTIEAFNKMQRQLQEYINDRTKMMAAISHDLRTPITSLRLQLEFIEDSEDKTNMHNTLLNMEKMIAATLAFAQDQSNLEASQKINLDSLIQTIVDDYQDRNIKNLKYDQDSIGTCSLPPINLRRMIENLINNSLQYAGGEQACISILCRYSGNKLIIQVLDSGPGITEDKLQEVLKPFVRLDKARDTNASSVGLGLAITRSLIQSYGGQLTLSNRSEGGLCAELMFPFNADREKLK